MTRMIQWLAVSAVGLSSMMLAVQSGLCGGAAHSAIRGDASAVARANGLLERIGGRETWASARTFYVKERGFLRSGNVVTLEVWRDFTAVTRHLIVHGQPAQRIEVLTESSGWEQRGDRVARFSDSEFAQERQGLFQEPYQIYHRLAKGDPKLRVDLEGTDKLNVYDENDRLLCWFVLDTADNPISWGNWFAGSVNQHWYGPLQRFGPVNLPKWGAASDGRWRFEYVDASFSAEPLALPSPPK